MITHCIILAAGINSRFPLSHPKSLISINNESLLERHVRAFSSHGIKSFTVVAGNNETLLRPHIVNYSKKHNVNIELIINPDYSKPNGYSVYHALASMDAHLHPSTFLTMGDHFFSEAFLTDFINQVITHKPENDKLILAVDEPGETNSHIDLDDVTKVQIEENKIVSIGKELTSYSHFDSGLFQIDSSFLVDLEECFQNGKASLSDAVNLLIGKEQAYAITVSGHFWNDIDTPSDLENTLSKKNAY